MDISAKVLLVEDDVDQGQEIVEFLKDEGFDVSWETDGNTAARRLPNEHFSLVITDLSLPGQNGVELTRKLRKISSLPVIVISGNQDPRPRVNALNIGADDFLVKPFLLEELSARVSATLRRVKLQEQGVTGFLKISQQTQFDRMNRILRRDGCRDIRLKRIDSEVLATLIFAAGEPISRQDLSQKILLRDWEADDRTIDNAVLRLRKALGEEKNRIISVRSVGYAAIF